VASITKYHLEERHQRERYKHRRIGLKMAAAIVKLAYVTPAKRMKRKSWHRLKAYLTKRGEIRSKTA